MFWTSPAQFGVAADNNDAVRTANYFLLSGSTLETKEAMDVLPKFDLLILPVEAQVYNANFFRHARAVNPDIIILAYVVSTSWNNNYWNDTLHKQMLTGIQNDWWLTDGSGNKTSNWPGLTLLNLNSGWNDYLATFVARNVILSGYWDGVFYDDVGEGISYIGAVDVNRDGQRDSAATADQLWRNGYVSLVSRTRALVGSKPIIVTNGSSRAELAPYVNGRMFEAFPTPWEGNWTTVMKKYLADEDKVAHDSIQIINGGTDNTGASSNYAKMRFGLTSTLLGGGYFGFDYGTSRHNDLWYYDEYDASLGSPIEEPQDRLSPSNSAMKSSVWERNFSGGKIIVNSTNVAQRIKLDGEYEHLHGTQDASVNNGRIVSSVNVNAQDGVVLLRRTENIFDASFINGSFVRIFDGRGAVKRNGFFSFDALAEGGKNVARYDLDRDGKREWVVAGNSRVDLYEDDGKLYKSFYPYTQSYKLGVNIAIGDLENDGSIEIITGTEKGGGPQIRIFNKDGNLIHPGFFAYDKMFRGGVNIAIGDLNGDNVNEIIAGAGVGGGPHVRVFNKDGKVINPGFFAYDPSFRGGVNVAVGDTDGDGVDDIITGKGYGGAPEMKIFDRDGKMKASFMAFDGASRKGVEVLAADFDGDGLAEPMGMSPDLIE
jgi:hypothetical protein